MFVFYRFALKPPRFECFVSLERRTLQQGLTKGAGGALTPPGAAWGGRAPTWGCDRAALQTHTAPLSTNRPLFPCLHPWKRSSRSPQLAEHPLQPHRGGSSCPPPCCSHGFPHWLVAGPCPVLSVLLPLRPSAPGGAQPPRIRPGAAGGASLAGQALGVATGGLQQGFPPHSLLGHAVVQPPQPLLLEEGG